MSSILKDDVLSFKNNHDTELVNISSEGLLIRNANGEETVNLINSYDGLFHISNVSINNILQADGSFISQPKLSQHIDSSLEVFVEDNTNAMIAEIKQSDSSKIIQINSGGDNDNPSIGTVSNDDFKILANSQEVVRIKSGGNVGIGTTSPLYPLEVVGSDTLAINSGSTNDASITMITTNRDSRFVAMQDNGDIFLGVLDHGASSGNLLQRAQGDIFFQSGGNTNRMTIDSSGNVGIGTTTPSELLDVNGSIRARGTGGSIGGTGNLDNAFLLIGSTSFGIGIDNNEITATGYNLHLSSTSNDIIFRTNSGTERMIILTGGNVGIGTSTPSELLDVNGNIAMFSGNSYDTNRYIYTQWTDMINDHSIGLEFDYYTGTGDTASTHSRLNIISNSFQNERIYDSGKQTTATFLSNGNVGIGVTSPTYPLEVKQSDSSISYTFGAKFTSGGVSTTGNTQSTNMSAKFNDRIFVTQGVFVSSDVRIKKNIHEINDNEALLQLRNIRPYKYNYIDEIHRGNSSVFGFIAQDVATVIPEAVSVVQNEYIPSIYQTVNCSIINSKQIEFEYENTDNLIENTTIQFFLPNTSNYFIGNITNTTDTSFIIELTENITVDTNTSTAFVYGEQVNDFYSLKKEFIFTIATAALQELDRQVQNLTTENESLKADNMALTQRLDDIEARLVALESSS